MGKKKNKNQNERKPRVIKIEGQFTAPETANQGLRINFTDQNISIEDVQGNKIVQGADTVEVGYERPKNFKILNKMIDGISGQDLNRELCKFDYVYAIDTNTKINGLEFVHVGALVKMDIQLINANKADCKLELIQGFHWKIVGGIPYPEQHSWYQAIELIKKVVPEFNQMNIGLIVDCDMGNLVKYNTREIPYYDDFLIPPNINLIYSSADSGSEEYLSNKAIRFADKMASKLLNENV